jgi:hypothetical protein
MIAALAADPVAIEAVLASHHGHRDGGRTVDAPTWTAGVVTDRSRNHCGAPSDE